MSAAQSAQVPPAPRSRTSRTIAIVGYKSAGSITSLPRRTTPKPRTSHCEIATPENLFALVRSEDIMCIFRRETRRAMGASGARHDPRPGMSSMTIMLARANPIGTDDLSSMFVEYMLAKGLLGRFDPPVGRPLPQAFKAFVSGYARRFAMTRSLDRARSRRRELAALKSAARARPAGRASAVCVDEFVALVERLAPEYLVPVREAAACGRRCHPSVASALRAKGVVPELLMRG